MGSTLPLRETQAVSSGAHAIKWNVPNRSTKTEIWEIETEKSKVIKRDGTRADYTNFLNPLRVTFLTQFQYVFRRGYSMAF